MKKLNHFLQFNFPAFAKGKKFMIQGIKYNEKRGCVSLDVIIMEDNTDYGDNRVSNLFEKFKVHLTKDTSEDDISKYYLRDIIVFKSIGKCTVWGDYASNLSVEAIVEVTNR